MIAEAVTDSPDGRRLLSAHELAEAGPPEAVRLPLDLVDPNPNNPRGQLIELDALAENIHTFGLLQPVTVRRQGERYELLGGHRRMAAFALLREREPLEPQWRTIPAVVRTERDDDRSYLMLISGQVHNRAWRPKEEAAALERLVLAGRNLKQVGDALNRSEAWASKRLRVYADAVLSGYVQSGILATGVAEELLPLTDVQTRKQLADRAVVEQWSQDKARAEVRALKLDRQITDLGRRGLELLDILSRVRRADLPISIFRDLMILLGRLESLKDEAIGGPMLPTVEAAERAAGITQRQKAATAKRAQDRRREARRRKAR